MRRTLGNGYELELRHGLRVGRDGEDEPEDDGEEGRREEHGQCQAPPEAGRLAKLECKILSTSGVKVKIDSIIAED